MGVYAVTGANSGIGAATAARLRDDGHEVIGVDLANAQINADLGSADERARVVAEINAACGGKLDGFVPAAGIGGNSTDPGGRLVAINYFGVIALLEGLRPALAAAGAASVVCIGSNSATVQPNWPTALAEACLGGDEAGACKIADEAASVHAYPAAKAALAWYVRSHAPQPKWIGAGIRLNAVAPGLTETPLADAQRADPVIGPAISAFPVPLGRALAPAEVAEVITFVLRAEAFVGSVIVADGGTEALLRPRDWPAPWHLPASE